MYSTADIPKRTTLEDCHVFLLKRANLRKHFSACRWSPLWQLQLHSESVEGQSPSYQEMPLRSLQALANLQVQGLRLTVTWELGTRKQYKHRAKLQDKDNIRGLLSILHQGPHLQGQSLGPQSLQNTVPTSNEVIHAAVNVLEGGVKLQ